MYIYIFSILDEKCRTNADDDDSEDDEFSDCSEVSSFFVIVFT